MLILSFLLCLRIPVVFFFQIFITEFSVDLSPIRATFIHSFNQFLLLRFGASGFHEASNGLCYQPSSWPLSSSFLLFGPSSTVLCQVVLGLPLLLFPWGFQSKACLSIALWSFSSVCYPFPFPFPSFYCCGYWFLLCQFPWVFICNNHWPKDAKDSS
jgi:hypothetical protein